MCINNKLNLKRNIRLGLIVLFTCAIVFQILWHTLMLLLERKHLLNGAWNYDVLIIIISLLAVIALATAQGYVDLKLSHFLYILQIDELRWTLMAAQACAAIFQTLYYGSMLLIYTLFESTEIFMICMTIFMICVELAFLLWSFSAAESLALNPFFINHILTSAT